MRMFRFFAVLAMLAAALMLGGCATVPMGDSAQDTRLKSFPPAKPGMAGLYIYRNETFGAAIKLPLVLDGASVGQSGPKTYFFTDIAPGTHTVVSQGENVETLSFNAVAGRLYFVWQEVKMGAFAARSKLHLVSDDAGRKGVQESALAVSNLPPARAQAAPPPQQQQQQVQHLQPVQHQQPATAAAPGRYAGRWSGHYRCGAYAGSTPTTTPGPWSIPVSMDLDGNLASLSRGDASYREELRGEVAGDGSLVLRGQGAMARSQNQPWMTQFQGRFGGSPERFNASGNMTGSNGIVFRTCTLDLVKG